VPIFTILGALIGFNQYNFYDIQHAIQRKIVLIDENIMVVTSSEFVYNVIIRGLFLAIIPTFLVEWIGFYILACLMTNVFVYPYYGYKYGKRWPQLSWIIGIFLTFHGSFLPILC